MIRRRFLIAVMLCASIVMCGCSYHTADSEYKKGKTAYEEKEYQKAAEYFKKAIDTFQDKGEYYIDYGYALMALHEYDLALEQFESVIMDKDITMVQENNKRAYQGLGITYLAMNDYDNALLNFTKALEIPVLASLDQDLQFYKASTLIQIGHVKEAIEEYTKILKKSPKDAIILGARANAYRLLKEYDLSIKDYDSAIAQQKNNFDFYFGKYDAYLQLQQTDKALEVLDAALLIPCDTKEDSYNIAKIHFYQKKYDYALSELQTSLDEGYTKSYFYLGEIYLANKDYKNALQMYQAYIDALEPVSAVLYNQMLTCSLFESDLESAEVYLKKAKLMNHTEVLDELMKNEIIFLEKKGEFEQALSLLNKYISRNPEDQQAKDDLFFLQTRVDSGLNQTEKDNKTSSVDKP